MSVGRSVLGVFATNAVNFVLSFGNSILLTRTLGVVGKGEFAIFAASYGILSLLLGFGLDVSIRYFVARERMSREKILTSLVLFVLAAGGIVFAAAHLNHAAFRNELFLPFTRQTLAFELVLAGVVVANLFYSNLSSVFAGTRSFRVLNLATIGFSALSLVVYAALLWAKEVRGLPIASDDVFVAYLALQLVNAGVLGALAYRILGVRPSLGLVDPGLLQEMVRYASKSYLAQVAQFLNYRVDIWIVQAVVGSQGLGLYSLAANLAMTVWVLPRSASSVLLPSVAAGDPGASLPETARLGRLIFVATVLLLIPFALTSGLWIELLYGGEFGGSAVPFVLLLVGCAPFTLCVIHAAALAGIDRHEINLKASAAGLVVTVALDLLLIPRYGIVGAAVASSASYLLTMGIVMKAFADAASLPLRAVLLPVRGDARYVIDGCKSLLR